MPPTGPRTSNGKARSSRNATRHGLLSIYPVLDGVEDPAEWDRHLQGVLDSFEPEGHIERVLADRIAVFLWRLRRVVRYETEMLSLGLDYDDDAETLAILTGRPAVPTQRSPRDKRQFIAARLIPGQITGPKTMRYEAHLHRQWLQTQHELEAMQARRRGESAPLARLDITGAPSG